MIKILITGAGSFIGKQFKKFSGLSDIDEISLIGIDPENVSFKSYDVVIHLAAIVHQSKSVDASQYSLINRDLAFRVAKKAKDDGVKHFIFFSTTKVYGDRKYGDIILNENSDCFPDDPYSKSKYEAELLIKQLNEPGFVVSVIRPSLVYGEGVKANMSLLFRLVGLIKFLPFGKIDNKRSYVYSQNLVALIDKVIEKRIPGTFLAVDPVPVSTSELIQFIASALEKKRYFFHLPAFIVRILRILFPGTITRLFDSFQFDNSLTLKCLDLSMPYTTEEGIRRTIRKHKKLKTKN